MITRKDVWTTLAGFGMIWFIDYSVGLGLWTSGIIAFVITATVFCIVHFIKNPRIRKYSMLTLMALLFVVGILMTGMM